MSFDVAGRLAAGELAINTFQTYIEACQCLGHHCQAASLAEQYNTEKGLDLTALDTDARSLAVAARVAQEALCLQDNGCHAVIADWSGTGGNAASGYLEHYGAGARAAVAQLCRSAAAAAGLRDGLARAVDAKVDAVLRAADQAAGRRAEWTAAAQTVIAGAGDLAAASEIVDQQVWPFVDQVICGQVLPALRASSDAVVAAYDSALVAVAIAPLDFGSPGSPLRSSVGFAPDGWPSNPENVPAAAIPTYSPGPGAAVPTWGPAGMSAWPLAVAQPSGGPVAPPAALASGVVPDPSAIAPAPVPAVEPSPAAPAVTSAGFPDGIGSGSGMGGLGRQLSDVVGGVLGAIGNLVPDGSDLGADGVGGLGELGTDGVGQLGSDGSDESADTADDLEGADKADDTEDAKEDSDDTKDAEDTVGDSATADDAAVTADGSPAVDPGPAPSEAPAPTPPPEPAGVPSVDQLPDAQPKSEPVAVQQPSTEKTPCQIAADQLPQVGE